MGLILFNNRVKIVIWSKTKVIKKGLKTNLNMLMHRHIRPQIPSKKSKSKSATGIYNAKKRMLAIGMAICNPKDQFVKRIGRTPLTIGSRVPAWPNLGTSST